MKDLLVCYLKSHGVAEGFAGTEVPGITRMGTAGDDYTYAVPLLVPVSSGQNSMCIWRISSLRGSGRWGRTRK